MACNKCKKKQEREQMMKEIEKTESVVKYIAIGLFILSLYGLYSLISFLI